jgi:hypothetical protein
MRFMMLVKANKDSEAGVLPSKEIVVDGPFAETKELLAGFWIIQVKSKDEAIAWASRAPFGDGVELEVRQVFEASDFPPEILSPEDAAREQAWRS